MSVQAEWAKRNHKTEYFVTIEGIGWPVQWNLLSSGFAGIVWATNDIDGDLATRLGCTVKKGLQLPASIDFSVDPRTAEFKMGGLDFTIEDRDDWWAENCTPRKQATNNTTLHAGIAYHTKTITLADGTNFSQGDAVWVGGRELIVLGTKALVAGTIYQYSGSTRAYLGTQRGSNLRRPADYSLYYWPPGTTVIDVARFWWNRKIALWAHIPGEAVANCQFLWMGYLRPVESPVEGRSFDFNAVGDFLYAANRKWKPREWHVVADAPAFYTGNPHPNDVNDTAVEVSHAQCGVRRRLTFEGPANIGDDLGQEDYGAYALAAAYRYRTEPGGTESMTTAWDSGWPQALDTANDTDILGSFVDIDGDVLFMFKRDPQANSGRDVLAEIISRAGTTALQSIPNGSRAPPRAAEQGTQNLTIATGTRARFLLANWEQSRTYNRFTVNGKVTKNPVDILLIFLTSCDREFWRGDTNAGSTTTRINLTLTGMSSNELVGKALHCVEGANKWEARVITANTTTYIDVETPFSNAPAAACEYQVRNSIYDVLPIGWGLGMDTQYLDVGSFELMRNKYFSDDVVDSFILGTQDDIDIWELLRKNICRPYGIMLYLDRESRKVAGRYLPHTPAIDDLEDYTTITSANILRTGRIRNHFVNPIGSVNLKVRSIERKVVGALMDYTYVPLDLQNVPSLFGGAEDTITIKNPEVECAFSENDLDQFSVEALFDTRNTVGGPASRLRGVIGQYSVPPPAWDPRITIDKWITMYPGTLAEIDWDDVPINPNTGVRGWANYVGRVLKAPLPLSSDGVGFDAVIELLAVKTRGKIAPASTVTGKGNDGSYDYWTVNDTDFVDDDTDKDWWHFIVGMELELRDATGAVLETETIHSFGSNHASNPEDAANSRVNVTGAIATAYAAGQYITLRTWYASNPAVNEDYSAYANASGVLAGSDPARRYL